MKLKSFVGLAVVAAMMWLAIPAQAKDGVSVVDGKLVLESVYWQPVGIVNFTTPWANTQAFCGIDVAHKTNNTVAGAKGKLVRITIQNVNVLDINWVCGSIVAGEINKGLFGGGLSLFSLHEGVTDNFQIGVFVVSAYDGTGLYYGPELSVEF